MPCTVRDASLVTVRNRNKALNSYYNSWKVATDASVVGVTPPAKTGAEVLTEAKLGCTTCYIEQNERNKDAGEPYDANVSRYPFNPSAGGASGLTGTS
jgi:hypothetical protein